MAKNTIPCEPAPLPVKSKVESGPLFGALDQAAYDINLVRNDLKEADKQPVGSPERIEALKSALRGFETISQDIFDAAKGLREALTKHLKELPSD